jgi:HEAT repeat protein
MKRADVFRLIDHLMAGGKTKGRRAAALALAAFTGAEANALAMRALADDDPHVQAAVLSQIRNRGIPGALPKLIEMIDSPHEVIRDAAQGSLGEFSFRRFLAAYDMIDEEVRRSTGMLVKKIDPTTIPMLKEQLSSKSRTRRLRSLSLAATIDAVDELGDMIIGLLSDGDHLVRGEAARALAGGRSPAVIAALEEALDDSSTAVREAAAESLERIHMAHPPAAAETEPAARQEATDE